MREIHCFSSVNGEHSQSSDKVIDWLCLLYVEKKRLNAQTPKLKCCFISN